MFQIKASRFDFFGIILLVFSIVFSFFFSFGYTMDGSQYDYLYYMHLVSDANYRENPMVAGTIFLYQPLSHLFGNTFWLWQRFHWLLNLLTICIPYIVLMDTKQQKRFAFVQALAILLFCVQRCGCEPPRLVLLFAVTAVTLFLKYTESHNLRYVWVISLLLALITFARMPSLFVYPLFVIAVLLASKNWKDTLLITILPVVFFCLFVTLTNGGLFAYTNDIKEVFSNVQNASPSHSVSSIFMKEVETTFQLIYFSVIAIIPFLLLLWKKKNTMWRIISCVIVLCVMNLIRINPIPRWACAITMVLCLFYIIENRASTLSLAKVLLIAFVPMITSVGSNGGFGYDYVAVAFLPYLAAIMGSVNPQTGQYSIRSFNEPFYKGLLLPAFAVVVATFFCSNLIVRFKDLRGALYDNGTISIVNAEVLSPNVRDIYFSEGTITPYLEAEQDYKILSKSENREVIFWGMDAHLMSIANDKWPVTRLWKVSSVEGDNAAMDDLERYVDEKKPIVIDMEKEENTFQLLSSLGYQRIDKKHYTIYK